MKFYRDKDNVYYWTKIFDNKLDSIYYNYCSCFYKNGRPHNSKNAAYKDNDGYKAFYLNDKCYGYNDDFTKKSWRRFVKLQALL